MGHNALTRCKPRIPREGGVYGVWIAGLALSLTVMYKHGFGYKEPLSLAGYMIALFLINPTIKYTITDIIVCSTVPLVLSIPLILGHGISSIPVILAAALAAIGMAAAPRYRQIIGAGLLVTPASLILLDVASPIQALLPMAYASMATAFALDVVVHGSSPGVRRSAYAASMVTLLVAALYSSVPIIVVIVLDILSRIVGVVTGYYYRMQLKKYGFLETFRVIIAMAAIGLLV